MWYEPGADLPAVACTETTHQAENGPHLSGENSSFRNYKQMQLVHFINDQHKQHKFVAQK